MTTASSGRDFRIQRASAGSGKTFTLARIFIWLFITIKTESGRRRLRTPAELSDAHSRILAITFTNKATAEMKSRIVEKLAALASDAPAHTVDYLREFAAKLGAGEEEIRRICKRALAVLLSDYSSFNVSTIDSFFQSVLRTFAYETDLNDAYQVEIDSDYITDTGIDAVLSSVNDSKADPQINLWIELLMKEKAAGGKAAWNVFQKSTSRHSLYSSLRSVSKLMQKEDFKNLSAAIDDYFEAYPDFSRTFLDYDAAISKPIEEAFEAFRLAAGAARTAWDNATPDLHECFAKSVESHLGKNRKSSLSSPPDYKFNSILSKGSALKAGKDKYPGAKDLDSIMMDAYRALDRWKAEREKPLARLWNIYRSNLVYLGLMRAVREKSLAFLAENDVVELADTNMLLRRVIGNDDAPFIYERLGTELDHFLIDEFQDTSELQWDNLRPLLSESDARGCDNLVIGDAKQSIYRFRNAAVHLITDTVPSEFPLHERRGDSAADNTNWRSELRIVQFNNSFFKALTASLQESQQPDVDLVGLYSNVVQPPHRKAPRGYVEWHTVEKSNLEEDIPEHFYDIGPMIRRMQNRGYRLRDIAILVRERIAGRKVIEAISEFNSFLPADEKPISFISEDSLSICESQAVKIVITALEIMRRGIKPVNPEAGVTGHTIANVADIACSYRFFCARFPQMPPAERLEAFMTTEGALPDLYAMVAAMQSSALPSLIEALIAEFVPEQLRREDAAFLAALQDAVLDYCESYPADVASFLNWWEAKGSAMSISSPEGTDAVSIMTIHKSKGLEFKCVVIPWADFKLTLADQHRDTLWVAPAIPQLPGCAPLPPAIPVALSKDLADSPHRADYLKAASASMVDAVNTVYVAFTRAIEELYVFTPEPKRTSAGSFSTITSTLLPDPATSASDPEGMLMPSPMTADPEAPGVLTFGEKSMAIEPAPSEKPGITVPAQSYNVNPSAPMLRFKEAETTVGADPEEDSDPRSTGNLLHEAMASVINADDIDRAVDRLHLRGSITLPQAEEFRKLIADAISAGKPAEWFAPGLRVLSERSLLRKGKSLLRPDRVVVDKQGNAVVIDYKFGDTVKPAYCRQVKEYVYTLRDTRKFRTVKGYVWYVKLGKIVSV